MNCFVVIFGERIKKFWDEKLGPDDTRWLLDDILLYANANVATFKEEIAEIQYDKKLQPLPLIFEALAADTDNWGHFFVSMLDAILDRAKKSDKPQEIADHLIEFAFIENQPKPFVQQIAARLYKELYSDNVVTKCAAISMLPNYLHNPIVKDKNLIIRELQTKLINPHWRVRYTAYMMLKRLKLLPNGFKLPVVDAALRIYYGRPYTM
ncbi:hypothetical protein [Mucilaginibacter glaciei]|uniref:Uncharacterized protein n=1 Tax=Mucilaginibacter glaciei TaxID=2772109 RepID=A0A926NWA8_9SPHI|nr:hypothetical protein [Mucilaginibacter glaciei]MBD1392899.1 hypothetical protein [Mucilaginibacter glaciei]